MEVVFENIYEHTIRYPGQRYVPRNLFIVKQPIRSLMVDTSMDTPQDREIIDKMLERLDISCRELDIFITHDHPDHSGLVQYYAAKGARILMNPDETKKRADMRHCYLADEATRIASLRTVGVTEEYTPELFRTIMEYTDRTYESIGKTEDFDFVPTPPGTVLHYGKFHFQVVPLRGHTNGQCGLYDEEHKLLFCGDQIMTDIVPIVCTQYKDWGMLRSYLSSLEQLKHFYADCLFLPAHGGQIRDIGKEVDRVVQGYMDKCSIMKRVLEEDGGFLTTRDVGVRAYGRSQGPPDYQHFMSCTQIWVKTFSCLEYLYGEGFLERKDKEGILYWKAKKPLAFHIL